MKEKDTIVWKVSRLFTGAGMGIGLFLATAGSCFGGIPGGSAFENLTWEKIYEEELLAPQGVLQSVCATEDYIVCIENTSDEENLPDTVSAYYRNDTDSQGNPVTPFSLALRNGDTNWEHGNGMAYNPSKKEIYVAPYTANNPENRGCVFIMDGENLQYKGKIKVSDAYNILGIGYRTDTDQYVIQTNEEAGFSFRVLDNQFQEIENLGEYQGSSVGTNFQDLHVTEDYILNFPMTLHMGIGDYLNVYSVSQKKLLLSSEITFPFTDVKNEEPEGICETGSGEFLAVVSEDRNDGRRMFAFYKTQVAYEEEAEEEIKQKPDEEVWEEQLPKEKQQEEKLQKEESMKELQDMEGTGTPLKEEHRISRKMAGIGAGAVVLAGLLFGSCLCRIHILRERKRKTARARIARQRIIWEKEAQIGYQEERNRDIV
ncbi:MAG: hypothetical protein ACI4EO_00445 [Blautia sp.]